MKRPKVAPGPLGKVRAARPKTMVRVKRTAPHPALIAGHPVLQPGGLLQVKTAPGRFATFMPSAFPGAAPQRLDGIVTVDNRPRGGLLERLGRRS